MNSTSPISKALSRHELYKASFKDILYQLAFGGRSPLLDSIESASLNHSSLIFLGDKELPGAPLNKVDCPCNEKIELIAPMMKKKVNCPYEKNFSQPLPALIPSCCFATVGSRQL